MTGRARLIATLVAFVLLWVTLDRTAFALSSFRGEMGLIVCVVTVAAAFAAEFILQRRSAREIGQALGLGAPNGQALVWTAALCAATLAFFPLYALATGARIGVRADAALLAIGIFAQAGIAEEVVFRGFLFRRMREGRSFWGGALLAAVPFVAVHALIFFTMEFAIALASVVLALALSFPLAWLFERSGGSIWPPALLHAVVQGAIKLVEVDAATLPPLAIGWMAVAAIAPWSLFLIRRA